MLAGTFPDFFYSVCDRDDCLVCKHGGEKNGDCKRRNIITKPPVKDARRKELTGHTMESLQEQHMREGKNTIERLLTPGRGQSHGQALVQ